MRPAMRQQGAGAQPGPRPAGRRFSSSGAARAALLAVVLACAVGGGRAAVGPDGKVPCAELPEFANIPNLPTIYGRCK